MGKPKIYKCNTCGATFMRPFQRGSRKLCPMPGCYSPDFEELGNTTLRFTKEEREDAALYKDDITGTTKWIKKDPNEKVKEGIQGKEFPKEELEAEKKRRKIQKQQSDYHKLRYKIKRMGKWYGSLQKSIDKLTDEEREELYSE